MAKFTITNLPARIDFEATDPVPRTVQNAKNLLMLRMGDVAYDRYRGLNPAIIDRPLPVVRQHLPAEIDRLLQYEPDADMRVVRCYMNGDGLVIEVDIEVEDYGD